MVNKKKVTIWVSASIIILTILIAIFHNQIYQTIVGSTTIVSFDGTYLHIPFSGSLIGGGGDTMIIEVRDGTNSIDQSTCDLIGWTWCDPSQCSITCSPNSELSRFPYTTNPYPFFCTGQMVGTTGESQVERTPVFDGKYISIRVPFANSFTCSGEILVNVNPPECTSDKCDGDNYYSCVDGKYIPRGQQIGKCNISCISGSNEYQICSAGFQPDQFIKKQCDSGHWIIKSESCACNSNSACIDSYECKNSSCTKKFDYNLLLIIASIIIIVAFVTFIIYFSLKNRK